MIRNFALLAKAILVGLTFLASTYSFASHIAWAEISNEVSRTSGMNQLYISAPELMRGEYLLEITPENQEPMIARFVIQ